MMAKRGWWYYMRNITRPRTESVSLKNQKNVESRNRNRAVSESRREHRRHIRHTGTEARVNQHVFLNAQTP